MDLNWLDIVAIIWFLLCWTGYGYYAKRQSFKVHCLANIMHSYRKEWALQILNREVRTSDIIAIGSLEKTTSFFASSSLVIIAALFTALGAASEAITFLQALPFTQEISYLKWEVMLSGLILIFIYAFFKSSWSLRQYNFSVAMISALPAQNLSMSDKEKSRLTIPISRLLSAAAYHFNCGLRAYYYSLAVFGWLIGNWFFIITTTLITFELYRREFKSRALKNLMPDQVKK